MYCGLYMLYVLWTVHVACIVDCTCCMYCRLYMLPVLWTVHVAYVLYAHKLYVHTYICIVHCMYMYTVSTVCIVSCTRSSFGSGLGDIPPSLAYVLCNS